MQTNIIMRNTNKNHIQKLQCTDEHLEKKNH